MPNPHNKSPILMTESGQLLLPMHERFLCVLKCASQVRILPDPDIFTFAMLWICCACALTGCSGFVASTEDPDSGGIWDPVPPPDEAVPALFIAAAGVEAAPPVVAVW